MPRLLCAATLLALAASLSCSPADARQQSQARPAKAVVGIAKDQPASSGEGREAIDGAIAGVLVGALTEQFGGRMVSVKLDRVDVLPSSIRDRVVNGEGRVQIGDDQDWVGFRFSTLYDTQQGSATYPDITLGGVASGEHEIPNDTQLVTELDDTVVDRLGKEFSNQAVRLQLDRITTVEAGSRYLRISATGVADFGRDGNAPAQVEALYDRRDRAWMRVNYELGPTASRDGDEILAGS